jgi:hypothetical protein
MQLYCDRWLPAPEDNGASDKESSDENENNEEKEVSDFSIEEGYTYLETSKRWVKNLSESERQVFIKSAKRVQEKIIKMRKAIANNDKKMIALLKNKYGYERDGAKYESVKEFVDDKLSKIYDRVTLAIKYPDKVYIFKGSADGVKLKEGGIAINAEFFGVSPKRTGIDPVVFHEYGHDIGMLHEGTPYNSRRKVERLSKYANDYMFYENTENSRQEALDNLYLLHYLYEDF